MKNKLKRKFHKTQGPFISTALCYQGTDQRNSEINSNK